MVQDSFFGSESFSGSNYFWSNSGFRWKNVPVVQDSFFVRGFFFGSELFPPFNSFFDSFPMTKHGIGYTGTFDVCYCKADKNSNLRSESNFENGENEISGVRTKANQQPQISKCSPERDICCFYEGYDDTSSEGQSLTVDLFMQNYLGLN